MSRYFVPLVIAAPIALLVLGLLIWAHRFYKKLISPCRGCGSIHVDRVYKIILQQGEKVSFRHPVTGKFRLRIYDVTKVKYAVCQKHGEIYCVKVDTGSISVVHAMKAWYCNHDQYEPDSRLNMAFEAFGRRIWHGKYAQLDPSTKVPEPAFGEVFVEVAEHFVGEVPSKQEGEKD